MTTETSLTLSLVVLADVAMLLAGGWRRALPLAFRHALGRTGAPGELRRSRELWLAASRNLWVLVALAALVRLGRTLGGGPGSPGEFSSSLVSIGTLVAMGAALALALLLPARRLSRRAADTCGSEGVESSPCPPAPDLVASCVGFLLLVILLAWPLALSSLGLAPAVWLLHWPAVLVVVGATTAMALYLGEPGSGATLAESLAAAGALGALGGLAQALHGFGSASIETVTSGIMQALGSCSTGLLGLLFVALPLLDRATTRGSPRKAQLFARAAAVVLPVLALLIVALTAAMIITPITRRV